MIDLNKIRARFNKLFQEETEESFNKWLAARQAWARRKPGAKYFTASNRITGR